MRRIYDSEALHRDDDDPTSPAERDRGTKPQAMRSVNSGAITRRIVPTRLRHWAVSVSIETTQETFEVGEHVPFRVTMKNAMPFPVTIATRSPLLWTWYLDDRQEASDVRTADPPEEPRGFEFDRGERKQFHKRWDGMIRVSESEWVQADPGEYTLSASLNVDDATAHGLADEVEITLR